MNAERGPICTTDSTLWASAAGVVVSYFLGCFVVSLVCVWRGGKAQDSHFSATHGYCRVHSVSVFYLALGRSRLVLFVPLIHVLAFPETCFIFYLPP